MTKGSILLVTTLALAGPACSKDAATTTTAASTARTTDTFTGTVPIAGSALHTFTVSQTGQVDATLTSAGPPSTIVMGLMIGLTADSKCVPFAGASAIGQAGTAPQLSGTISAGTLCVEVHDIGNQTDPVTYTVTVTHP